MFELLSDLTALPGVSGYEKPVRDFIISRLALGREYRTDNIGNLIVERGSGAPHIALVAHMDEVGLIVTKIEMDGSLRFRNVGGIDDRILLSRKVMIHAKGKPVLGVIGVKPPHLWTDEDEGKKTVPLERLRIDVGTRSKSETEKLGISILSPVTLEKDLLRMGKDLVVGRSLDDRTGCAILMQTFERLKGRKLKGRVSFVWSVQEEMGLRGGRVICHTMKPDYVIVLDTCSTSDSPGLEDGHLQPAVLGKGAVLRMFDSLSIASPMMREAAKEVARKNKIPIQEIVAGGSTDGTAVQESGSAVLPIGVGMRNTHSTTEIVNLKDVESAVKLVTELVARLAK